MAEENKYIQSLKENAQLGKLVALEELYKINLNCIYTLILRLAGNKSLAELITKNTLVTAWKEIKESGPDDITFSEWLKNIAVKITTDELRNNSVPKRKNKVKDDQPEGSSSERLEQVIADLDDDSRIILVLNKIENRSLVNISQLLSKTESDIEKKLSDATDRISNSITNAESSTDINKLSATIPKELEADIEVLQSALDEIMEIRFEEIQESKDEIEAEELEEFRQYEERKKEERRKEAEEKKTENKTSKRGKELKIYKKIVLQAALPIVILVFLVYFFTSTATGKASSTSGNPLLNKVPFTSFVDIYPGDLITTDNISTAIVEIPDVGTINLLNGTSFKRLKKDNSYELLHGRVYIKAKGTKRNLNVVIPKA
ncbi:MAG: sigma-70 family RNA polymerase sigma factor, partial [Ignavibacteria bacterium]|nr:sigma-70 family RNA polymerase sigma factor [Ignavibacteria bacterium]